MNGRVWGGFALIAAATLAVAASKPDGGRILKAEGAVAIERGGSTLNAEQGTVIGQGDTIRTGGDGKGQWWMQDDSLFLLISASELHIDQYALPQNKDQSSGRSVMSLLKGGMRTVTGFIAHNNPSGYKITTPVATMGVRGTDFSAVLCQDDCSKRQQRSGMRKMKLPGFFGMPHLVKVAANSTAQALQNGLYVKVDKGTVSMCGSGGCADIAFSAEAQSSGGSCGFAAAGQKPGPIKCPQLFKLLDFDFEFTFDAGEIDIFRDLDRIIPEPPGSRS